jgi:hypothetical protein
VEDNGFPVSDCNWPTVLPYDVSVRAQVMSQDAQLNVTRSLAAAYFLATLSGDAQAQRLISQLGSLPLMAEYRRSGWS